jgi:xanthine dehydrogenase large subunit
MQNIDSFTHTRGESIYLDDIPLVQGTLFGAAFPSPVAHGKIKSLDLSLAENADGVVRIFTYKDIPGENQIGGIVQDEPLLAEDVVDFCGMPIVFVVAESEELARAAVKKIKVEIEPLHIITDPREAKEKGKLIVPPRTFRLGDVDAAWKSCEYVFEGRADSNGQEHLYIETQGAYAIPGENDTIKIYSSTQSPRAVQVAAKRTMGVAMHQVDVETIRLGGGFGGKEDQANMWGALCSLAAYLLKRPVKYCLHRMEDMAMTGKRHPYSSDFKIGLDKNFKILAYEASFYQNAGATADLSPAVLERTLFHATNSYFVPNFRATAYSCRTNLPSNTAFRGFGGPQGMFVIESAITMAAESLGIDRTVIQKQNLIRSGEEFSYGQKAESEAPECWSKAESIYKINELKAEIEKFNRENKQFKKGYAFMPICFGISFTNTSMNQARALVHVYSDGSVSVTTGAIEMGQGVNTKMLQVASRVFSLPGERIRVQSTSTYKIANTSPSAASATADLNGKAVLLACTEILKRLKKVASEELKISVEQIEIRDQQVWVGGQKTDWDWNRLVFTAFLKRENLSEHSHYATPVIHFDKTKEKGHPFAYHVYGTGIITVTVDCLRGTYEVDSVNVVHDFGQTMNPIIDKGQMEGGIVQGLGWMTMEELVYDKQGRLRSNALSTYKVPDIYSVPKEINIEHLRTERENLAIFRSKAVGEPPLMYGIGAYFALRNAVKSFNPGTEIPFDSPMTPEKVLMALYPDDVKSLKEKYEQATADLATNS